MNAKYILVIGLTIFVIIIGLFVISLFSTPKENKKNPSVLSPTPVESQGNIINKISVTPTQIIPYTSTNNDKRFGTDIDNKPPLSASTSVAKQNLVNSLKSNNGEYQANEFKVMYITAYDIFQVEIEITDIKKAEDATLSWFVTKGLNKEALCKIPVQFYLNFYIKQQLNQDIPPLFYGC